MKRRRRRKCLCCRDLFHPDPRNQHHQHYCAKPACRRAAKAASQQRWLNKKDNRDYFRGPLQVARVRAWRQAHPGYWRRQGPIKRTPLQEVLLAESPVQQGIPASLMVPALQEVLAQQSTVLVGLIAHITDSSLQEEIAESSRRLLQRGQDILARSGGYAASQTAVMPRAGPRGATAV
jgi:hypothetical protein